MDNFNISVEGFPTIEKVLEKTYVSKFEKEKSEMTEKRQIKLSNEETSKGFLFCLFLFFGAEIPFSR